MGQKVFISYADENLAYSLKRIGGLAERTKLFDEVILYTPADLPDYIFNSPLMKYKRGGGYWAWKPVLIWETLQKFPEGTVVVYADAGCTVKKSSDWNEYFDTLIKYDALCFQYRDVMHSWKQFGQDSTKIKYWSKRQVVEYFSNILADHHYSNKYNMIWGGCMLIKSKNNQFLKEWLDIVLNKPELILDPTHEEHIEQFVNGGFHTHDQAVITPLAHLYNDSVCVIDEKAETSTTSGIVGSRIRAKTKNDFIILMVKRGVRKILGDSILDYLKLFVQKCR